MVKGFWKYQMEKMRLRNFLSVTTRVTVRLAHSVVRTNTDEIQTYWVVTLASRYSTMMGRLMFSWGMVTGVLDIIREK